MLRQSHRLAAPVPSDPICKNQTWNEEAVGPTSSGSDQGPALARGQPGWGCPGEDEHPPGERKASSSVATVKGIVKSASARGTELSLLLRGRMTLEIEKIF
jgi:hypothetical protein